MSNFNRDKNRAVWFDIPVIDLDRAAAFYNAVLGLNVHVDSFGDTRFGVLEHDEGNGGCLVIQPEQAASERGVLLYLNVHGRIRDAVKQVVEQGGRVVEDIHSLGPHGFRALVLDSEGNRVALLSDNDA